MKPVSTFLFFTFLLAACFSCGNKPYPNSLLTAENLINSHPDSALALLDRFGDSISIEPQYTQMLYQLLRIKAKDKLYIPHASDHEIKKIVNYFKGRRDNKYLSEAYYYAGRVYSDLHDAPQALDYFNEAATILEEYPNNELRCRLHSQIGTLYLYQDIYDKALPEFKKAYHYSLLSNNSVSMVFDLRDFGRTYSTLNEQDSAIHYYKKADKLAEKINRDDLRRIINGELSAYFTLLGRYEEAYKSMQISSQEIDSVSQRPRLSTIAKYYFHTNQLDSATYYYSLLSTINDYSSKAEGYQGLSNIAYLKGDYKKAIQCIHEYQVYKDSASIALQTETVRKINALYNYQLREKENNKLKNQTERQNRYITIAVISVLLMLALIVAYRQKQKKLDLSRLIQLDKLKSIQKEKDKQSKIVIEQNKNRIKQLEKEIKEAEESQNQLQQELFEAQKKSLEKDNEQIEARQIVDEKAIMVLKVSPIYRKFNAEQSRMSIEDWNELANAIDRTYNQFTQRLLSLYPMTEIEVKVCLLIKTGVQPRNMAEIVSRSKQAVSSIRERLYYKVFKEKGTPEDWDKYIQQF